jgi:hypothetical protein
MAFIYDLADTWNDGGTTFTGIGLNVTDTASASGSLLMDLQVGGSSKFNVDKGGTIVTARNTTSAPALQCAVSGGFYSGLYGSQYAIEFGLSSALGGAPSAAYGTLKYAFTSRTLTLGSGSTSPVIILPDAANILAQRNGTNAQTFNLYNTYTDASNYERGFMKWNSNTLQIGTEAAGTGATRNLVIRGGANPSSQGQILISTALTTIAYELGIAASPATSVRAALQTPADNVLSLRGISGGVGGSFELWEMTAPAAPTANRVRIYAEDDGTGKTRLMARFATGAAQQIAIEP